MFPKLTGQDVSTYDSRRSPHASVQRRAIRSTTSECNTRRMPRLQLSEAQPQAVEVVSLKQQFENLIQMTPSTLQDLR
jgi:hypothetical protein